jgi:NAD(P)H-dependent flavin oxidoreductase YrpB (nitropropane dioxygenase family)
MTHPALRTRLCELVGVEFPIVQTGMGYVAGASLAAATANAGGLGIIASATMDLGQLADAIARVKERTTRPFGVNLVVTTRVDGWAHRVLRTPFVEKLLATGPLADLPRALANAVRFQRMSGARWSDLVREALAMRKNQDLTWAQTLMAANTPMLLHASMVKGDLRSG